MLLPGLFDLGHEFSTSGLEDDFGLKSRPMHRTRLMPLTVVMVLCLLGASCRKRGKEPNLHDRITSAHSSEYCRPPDACTNPHILAVETGYYLTTFLGSKPQYAQVAAKDLAQYLQSLPMQAWPRGPSIAITPSDDVTDQHAVEQNVRAAQQLCRSLGLEVQILPGG